VVDEGLEVESGIIGIFCFVGAEAIQRGLRGVADFFQGGFLIVGKARAVEGDDGLQADGGFGLARFVKGWGGGCGLGARGAGRG